MPPGKLYCLLTVRLLKYHHFFSKSLTILHFFDHLRRRQGTPLRYSCLENPWIKEPGRPQSMGSRRVGYDWATSLSLFTFMHWRRKWQPTLMFLPGESQGRGSLVGCRLWGRTESGMTEATYFTLPYLTLYECYLLHIILVFGAIHF